MKEGWVITVSLLLVLGCGGSTGGNGTAEPDPVSTDTGGSSDPADTGGKSPDELRKAYEAKYQPVCEVQHQAPESDAERLVIHGDADVDIERGSLEKAQVKQVIDSNMDDVRTCYDGLHAWWPEAEGRVLLRFGIDPEGKVIAVKVRENDVGIRTLGCCIAAAVKKWRFPAPDGNGYVIVNYPFDLEPTL